LQRPLFGRPLSTSARAPPPRGQPTGQRPQPAAGYPAGGGPEPHRTPGPTTTTPRTPPDPSPDPDRTLERHRLTPKLGLSLCGGSILLGGKAPKERPSTASGKGHPEGRHGGSTKDAHIMRFDRTAIPGKERPEGGPGRSPVDETGEGPQGNTNQAPGTDIRGGRAQRPRNGPEHPIPG
jgi:hypothetical protein